MIDATSSVFSSAPGPGWVAESAEAGGPGSASHYSGRVFVVDTRVGGRTRPCPVPALAQRYFAHLVLPELGLGTWAYTALVRRFPPSLAEVLQDLALVAARVAAALARAAPREAAHASWARGDLGGAADSLDAHVLEVSARVLVDALVHTPRVGAGKLSAGLVQAVEGVVGALGLRGVRVAPGFWFSSCLAPVEQLVRG